jgi:16S rRNA (adenine1518-N6/adenine1519-N6)-dimethyltransferase
MGPASRVKQFHKAKKSLGQNFLVDSGVADEIVDNVEVESGATVIEIGPGHGALTERMLRRSLQVIAIEYDSNLCLELKDRFKDAPNFTLIEADALDVDYCRLIKPSEKASVVANLPYNISTPVLQRLIDCRNCLSRMVLMLQREVVDRISAEPGDSERGYFSVIVQSHCFVERLFDVAPTAFKPVPAVWSSVAGFRFEDRINFPNDSESVFRTLVGTCFLQKRKTILNNLKQATFEARSLIDLAGGEKNLLEQAGIDPRLRAEALSFDDWQRLLNSVVISLPNA